MRLVVQRVQNAKCIIENVEKSSINQGYVVLLGVSDSDNKEIADKMIKKLINLRIFEDENGKTNLSIDKIGGEIMVISQFTLYANCKKGNRPSFIEAGKPDMANELYEYFVEQIKNEKINVATGEFGADMKISLINDGPFTIYLDSDDLF
ncbi:MAG: D-tyrosyl-tRNA(Tyr) deacylase [Lachnospiraceae bacterium]|nr:D-tyrosyl-tRNA(Tyr) deacylase [Lachnospiraceae bacterium]